MRALGKAPSDRLQAILMELFVDGRVLWVERQEFFRLSKPSGEDYLAGDRFEVGIRSSDADGECEILTAEGRSMMECLDLLEELLYEGGLLKENGDVH